jgi:hypothetical protein
MVMKTSVWLRERRWLECKEEGLVVVGMIVPRVSLYLLFVRSFIICYFGW